MADSKIMICGDIHGDWASLNTLISKKKPSLILQAGDFGYWPREPKYALEKIKPHDTKIYFCDGNHEDHWALKDVKDNELAPNIFYMSRGSVMTLPDGRNVLFFGGADSIDKEDRTLGFDWFPEEIPSYRDLAAIDKLDMKIDIVISHTCPEDFTEMDQWKWKDKVTDPTRKLLSVILDRFKPDLWYFGHWHDFLQGTCKGCKYTMMGHTHSGRWGIELE